MSISIAQSRPPESTTVMAQTIHLADTNVISEFVEKTPDARVMHWLQTVSLLTLSAVPEKPGQITLAMLAQT